MYTHVGRIGISWRDSTLERNPHTWHAVNHFKGNLYKGLCGKQVIDIPGEKISRGDQIREKRRRIITCKTCIYILSKEG
jgi:hypothetical protein